MTQDIYVTSQARHLYVAADHLCVGRIRRFKNEPKWWLSVLAALRLAIVIKANDSKYLVSHFSYIRFLKKHCSYKKLPKAYLLHNIDKVPLKNPSQKPMDMVIDIEKNRKLTEKFKKAICNQDFRKARECLGKGAYANACVYVEVDNGNKVSPETPKFMLPNPWYYPVIPYCQKELSEKPIGLVGKPFLPGFPETQVRSYWQFSAHAYLLSHYGPKDNTEANKLIHLLQKLETYPRAIATIDVASYAGITKDFSVKENTFFHAFNVTSHTALAKFSAGKPLEEQVPFVMEYRPPVTKQVTEHFYTKQNHFIFNEE